MNKIRKYVEFEHWVGSTAGSKGHSTDAMPSKDCNWNNKNWTMEFVWRL